MLAACNRKSLTERHCKYSIEDLKENTHKASAHIKTLTILEYYISGFEKLELYKKKIGYGTSE